MKDVGSKFIRGTTPYRNCRWCHGVGCLACQSESDRDYKAAFPDGPKPIATFKTDDPKDMKLARKTIGREALDKAFGPKGGGIQDILDNCRKATAIQKARKRSKSK